MMEELEKWKTWLLGFGGLEGRLCMNHTGPELGSTGLFPMGIRVLHQQEDVLGNRYLRCRGTCQLRRVDTVAGGAAWIEDLAKWVQTQNAMGSTPPLGQLSQRTVSAENGRLQKRDSGGTATYCVDLIAEYTQVYPAAV